jgi:hypothetical protein
VWALVFAGLGFTTIDRRPAQLIAAEASKRAVPIFKG